MRQRIIFSRFLKLLCFLLVTANSASLMAANSRAIISIRLGACPVDGQVTSCPAQTMPLTNLPLTANPLFCVCGRTGYGYSPAEREQWISTALRIKRTAFNGIFGQCANNSAAFPSDGNFYEQTLALQVPANTYNIIDIQILGTNNCASSPLTCSLYLSNAPQCPVCATETALGTGTAPSVASSPFCEIPAPIIHRREIR
ncbi:MAG: hypothetical protein V4623_04910 [Pseudomonadota bacterium]